MNKNYLRLYALADCSWRGRLEDALLGGVTMVQFREKEPLNRETLLNEALAVQELCRRHHVPFLIDDDVDMALELDADGVHVGQSDMEAGEARGRLGPDKILGVSARTVEQALLAQARGADYLGVGAVFPTGSKADAQEIGPERLGEICRAVRIPVVAIGGINRHNASRLAGSGISGIAVIGALSAAPDIRSAAAELRALSESISATGANP